MGGTAKRVGVGIATGGMSELDRAGIGPVAGLSGKVGASSKGGKNGGPKPPDFQAAAEEQSRTSHNDVSGSFGGAKWSQTPDGRWSLDMNMAPELQAQSQRLMGSLGNAPDPAAARDQAISSAYQMQTSRLDPRFSQARASQEAQLANEGFSRGDAGWTKAMDNFGRQENDAYQEALLGAQSGAGNTAYAQALAGAMQPYQQLQAIRGMGEGTGLAALGQAQPTNSLAAASALYNGQLQNYGIEQQGKNSMMGGAANLGGLAILKSDERLKTEIVRSNYEVIPGVPAAEWRWESDGSHGYGVIAQDVERVRPDLVVVGSDGFRMVDYGGLLAAAGA